MPAKLRGAELLTGRTETPRRGVSLPVTPRSESRYELRLTAFVELRSCELLRNFVYKRPLLHLVIIIMPIGHTTQAGAPFKPPAKIWPTVKDADLERLLERLDRILRDVEQVADHIAERLGVELTESEGLSTTHNLCVNLLTSFLEEEGSDTDSDSSEKSRTLRFTTTD
nr:MAG: hypothetical protein [Cressdnaviricota sp.]